MLTFQSENIYLDIMKIGIIIISLLIPLVLMRHYNNNFAQKVNFANSYFLHCCQFTDTQVPLVK